MQSDEGYLTQYCSAPVCSIECWWTSFKISELQECATTQLWWTPCLLRCTCFWPSPGHDDKWEATDGRPHTSTLKLEVKHTHGRPGEGDTQPLGSAEGLANHVDEPPCPMEFNPCPLHVDDSAISSSGYAIGPIPLEISQLLPFATMPVYSKYDHAKLLYSAYPMKIN